MSLNWNWNENIGTLEIEQHWEGRGENDGTHTWTLNLYIGNAELIVLHETEEQYNMYTFFCDKDHLKNCVKNCPEIFEDWKVLTINVAEYMKRRDWNTLTRLLKAVTKCNPNCKIVLQ